MAGARTNEYILFWIPAQPSPVCLYILSLAWFLIGFIYFMLRTGQTRPDEGRPGPGLGTDNLTANKHHNNTNIQLISLSHPPHSLVFLHWKLSQHKMVLRPNRNSKVKTPILSRSWNGWAWPLVYLILTAISGIKFGFSFLGPTGWDRLGHCEINGLLEVCSVLSLSLLLL